jgi:hypothetical protein
MATETFSYDEFKKAALSCYWDFCRDAYNTDRSYEWAQAIAHLEYQFNLDTIEENLGHEIENLLDALSILVLCANSHPSMQAFLRNIINSVLSVKGLQSVTEQIRTEEIAQLLADLQCLGFLHIWDQIELIKTILSTATGKKEATHINTISQLIYSTIGGLHHQCRRINEAARNFEDHNTQEQAAELTRHIEAGERMVIAHGRFTSDAQGLIDDQPGRLHTLNSAIEMAAEAKNDLSNTIGRARPQI